jgi:hypothetical protein
MTAAFDELQAMIQEEIQEQRKTTIEELGGRELALRLAVPPLWTRTVAVESGFLAEPEQVSEFVQQACDVGWCETWGSLSDDGPTELCFWMPDAIRRGVLDTLLAGDGGRPAVQDEARQVAASVRQCPGDVVPGELRAWADLCAVSENKIPDALVERVKQAIVQGDVGTAQELASAGNALEPMIEGGALPAMSRVRRMLERERHKRQDELALVRYLERQELSGAMARLLAPNATQWALHLQGAGGVGKTMFIRYLAAGEFARSQGLRPIPIARVDFDHMPADYPVTKPVQLLLELADDLALETAFSVQADRRLETFRYSAEWANQAASSLRESSPRLPDTQEDTQAIDAFADAVSELGGALLILDTCEELAKWGAGNPDTPAIQRTLDIVERLHDRAPSVRVLIAGRRPLPDREWLAVQEVPGFTVREARRYLAEFADRALADDLVEEMIRQSPAIDEPPPGPRRLPARVNPFDLALYRAWADREPSLSPADITGGNDAYIDRRIIERLRDDPLVTRSLPMLAVGDKCRVETIAEVLGCDPADLGRRLGAQEWIEAKGTGTPVFVKAQPALAWRLRRYYEAPRHREQLHRETRRFAEVLLRRLRDALLGSSDAGADEVDADEVVAALRLADSAEAIGLWDWVEAWAVEPPGRWHTVGKVTSRILGEAAEGELALPDAFCAAIQAANIAAYRREVPLADVREPWSEVLAFADRHPEPGRQQELRLLGALGSLPYAPKDEALWQVLDGGRDVLLTAPRVFTAAVDAMHRLLEAADASAAGHLSGLLDLGRLAGSAELSRALAWARTAEARLLADLDPDAAQQKIREAERLASAATGPEPAWPYWVPPDDLLARVRIERGLIDLKLIDLKSIPGPFSLAELQALLHAKLGPWEEYATRYLDSSGHLGPSVDRERLASLCLRIRLRHGVMPASEAQRWESADRYVRGRVATNSAHDLVPPLFVSVAEAWLSAGQPERALALLEQRRSEANQTLEDDATVRHANAGIVSLLRRLHVDQHQRSLLMELTKSAGYHRSEAAKAWIDMLDDAWRAWAVINREPFSSASADTGRLAGWHAWWQCQLADVSSPVPRPPWSPDSQHDDDDLPSLADIRADLMEMELLKLRELKQSREQLDDRLFQVRHRLLTTARSPDPYHDTRLDLRLGALGDQAWEPHASAPIRLKAEMAFDEAELLALRLPAAAASIYLIAADGYRSCGDNIGWLLALAGFHDVVSECQEKDRPALLELANGPEVRPGMLTDARQAVGTGNPPLAATEAGSPEDADLWRYWAQTIQRVAGDLPETGQVGVAPSAVLSKAPRPTVLGGVASAVMTIVRVLLRVPAVPLAVLLAGGARSAFRLAAERGVGVVRPEMLLFDATVGGDAVRLLVRPRSTRLPGRRSRLWLRAITVAVRLLRFCWPAQPAGYRGLLAAAADHDAPASFAWEPRLPAPGSAWWGQPRQLAAAGTIRADQDQAAQPWERILATSLGPDAAGQIEWIRLGADRASPAPSEAGRGAELIAPPAWERLLGEHYRRAAPSAHLSGNSPVRVRHVIGRVVKTSAGLCMDVRGEVRPARGETLLTATELVRGHPLVVVLEAEPVGDEDVGTVRNDDLADKLRLATALIEDGVPAVLILPPLPVSCAHEAARTVAAFAEAPGVTGEIIRGALLRPLRQAIAGHVEHAVLDDIILFLNKRLS